MSILTYPSLIPHSPVVASKTDRPYTWFSLVTARRNTTQLELSQSLSPKTHYLYCVVVLRVPHLLAVFDRCWNLPPEKRKAFSFVGMEEWKREVILKKL